MATVITGDPRRAERLAASDPASLVVRIGRDRAGAAAPFAEIRVAVRGAPLAAELTRAVAASLRAIEPPRALPSVRVRSRKALDAIDPESLAGAIAVVPVTRANRRRLAELVEALRERAAGVQLVWDGREPARACAEPYVFAVLERARATPARAPVVLARGEAPMEALRTLVACRAQREKETMSP